MPDGDPSIWDHYRVSYVLNNARIVAAVLDGGAIVENIPRLLIEEGRQWSSRSPGIGADDRLEYELRFTVADAKEPLAAEAIDARIIIEGTHDNGQYMEIRGEGWIGYDDHGQVEGHYDTAPEIFLAVEGQIETGPRPQGTDGIRLVSPRPSVQYLQAARGRPSPDDEPKPA